MYKYNSPYRDLVGTYKQSIPSYGLRLANLLGKIIMAFVPVLNSAFQMLNSSIYYARWAQLE